MYAPVSYAQQVSICRLCPPMLRWAEACPRMPDLLTMPAAITADDLYTAEQLAELRELQVPFHTFRENLIMNESMHQYVMNLVLYSTYFYEMLMIATSIIAAILPMFIYLGFVFTRKPEFCRATIMHLVAKTCFFFWNDDSFRVSKYSTYYICTLDGTLQENMGLSEPCFIVSVFFTYLTLSSLMSMNNWFCRNIIQRMNFAFYTMMVGAGFLFVLHLSKMHLMQSSQTVIITSIELGMGFAIVFLIIMIGAGFWPIRLSTSFDSLPEEELLLNHLCMKWNISTSLEKLDKMTCIMEKLDEVLKAKADIDKLAQDLASKQQEDPLIYRKLIEDPNWDKMQNLLDEMLNYDCKNSYFQLQQEILQLKELNALDEPQESRPPPKFVPNTPDGKRILLKKAAELAKLKARQRSKNSSMPHSQTSNLAQMLQQSVDSYNAAAIEQQTIAESSQAASVGQRSAKQTDASEIFKPRLQLPAMTSSCVTPPASQQTQILFSQAATSTEPQSQQSMHQPQKKTKAQQKRQKKRQKNRAAAGDAKNESMAN